MKRCAAWCPESTYRRAHPCDLEAKHLVHIKGRGFVDLCSSHRAVRERGKLELAERPRRLTPC